MAALWQGQGNIGRDTIAYNAHGKADVSLLVCFHLDVRSVAFQRNASYTVRPPLLNGAI